MNLLLFIFISLSAFAQKQNEYTFIPNYYFNETVRAARDGEKILLQGSNCDLLKSEANAIAQWSKKQDLAASAECNCKQSNCSIDITSFSPKLLQEKQSVCTLRNGPNCWNLSLVSTGVADQLRYSTPAEINFWMESPLCKKRKDGEKKEPGDVIAIRTGRNNSEVHSFIHLSDNLSFSKNGYHKDAPYTLQSPEYLYKIYEVEPGCQGIDKIPTEKKCSNYSNAYRCISLDEYLKTNPIKSQKQQEIFQELKEVECQITDFISLEKISPDLFQLTNISLTAIYKLADSEHRRATSDKDKFIWDLISVRARAMLVQNEITIK